MIKLQKTIDLFAEYDQFDNRPESNNTKKSLPLPTEDGKIKFEIRVIEDGKVRKPLFIAEI